MFYLATSIYGLVTLLKVSYRYHESSSSPSQVWVRVKEILFKFYFNFFWLQFLLSQCSGNCWSKHQQPKKYFPGVGSNLLNKINPIPRDLLISYEVLISFFLVAKTKRAHFSKKHSWVFEWWYCNSIMSNDTVTAYNRKYRQSVRRGPFASVSSHKYGTRHTKHF